MDYFLELTKMERIETMRLALETIAAIKQFPKPKLKSDITQAVRDLAGAYAIYLAQKQKTEVEQPAAAKLNHDCSSDLVSSLYAKP